MTKTIWIKRAKRERTNSFDVIDVDVHDVHGLVVGSRCEEVSSVVPRCAVDGTFVVLRLC